MLQEEAHGLITKVCSLAGISVVIIIGVALVVVVYVAVMIVCVMYLQR